MISFSPSSQNRWGVRRIEKETDLVFLNMQSQKLHNFGEVETLLVTAKRLQKCSLQDTVHVFRKGKRVLVIKQKKKKRRGKGWRELSRCRVEAEDVGRSMNITNVLKQVICACGYGSQMARCCLIYKTHPLVPPLTFSA